MLNDKCLTDLRFRFQKKNVFFATLFLPTSLLLVINVHKPRLICNCRLLDQEPECKPHLFLFNLPHFTSQCASREHNTL